MSRMKRDHDENRKRQSRPALPAASAFLCLELYRLQLGGRSPLAPPESAARGIGFSGVRSGRVPCSLSLYLGVPLDLPGATEAAFRPGRSRVAACVLRPRRRWRCVSRPARLAAAVPRSRSRFIKVKA